MREKIQREAKMRNVKQGGFDTLVKLKMKADEVAEWARDRVDVDTITYKTLMENLNYSLKTIAIQEIYIDLLQFGKYRISKKGRI